MAFVARRATKVAALNNFGLKFRDNGYQLMNERDSPIWQNPGYWPVTFRITPIWHRVSSLNQVDVYTPENPTPTGSRPNASRRPAST